MIFRNPPRTPMPQTLSKRKTSLPPRFAGGIASERRAESLRGSKALSTEASAGSNSVHGGFGWKHGGACDRAARCEAGAFITWARSVEKVAAGQKH